MAYSGNHLHLLATTANGEFSTWAYLTNDPLDEVLSSSYFRNHRLRTGDRISVSAAGGRQHVDGVVRVLKSGEATLNPLGPPAKW